ncbi:Beta-1,4-Galactosyltransferase 6 [Manis pentadactyla]|nr:Beta-1,4-Galactosyltransferase 6 [Manis pentadactyla]
MSALRQVLRVSNRSLLAFIFFSLSSSCLYFIYVAPGLEAHEKPELAIYILYPSWEREQQAKIQTQEAAGRCADDNWFTMAVRLGQLQGQSLWGSRSLKQHASASLTSGQNSRQRNIKDNTMKSTQKGILD